MKGEEGHFFEPLKKRSQGHSIDVSDFELIPVLVASRGEIHHERPLIARKKSPALGTLKRLDGL